MQGSEITIRSQVDSDFLDKAEQEIFEILLKQQRAFSDYWNSNKIVLHVISILRLVGLTLSVLGCAFGVFVFLFTPSWCPAWFHIKYYTLAFLVLAIMFYYLPFMERAIQNWGRSYAPANCRKLARRCVKQARQQAPYIAEYHINGDTITYHRVTANDSKLAWTRKLTGVALQGRLATVLFRKWTAFSPRVIILHDDFEPIRNVLERAGVESKKTG